ncbi:DMT family transporter [Celeribacter litoreus]|uniref:DMT family transporter n=1 Tax=Celeribacter litoreus TaxID=2876714 RepID=UPI001CCC0CED|nr:DMT family transporter [Celeribacter litoreus]MCA0044842.1 DMT family transporter [Celeribacter litoreus]
MTIPPKAAAATATMLWGFTYILTTTMLPPNPWFIAAVRALFGGLPLLLLARDLPPKAWWGKLIVLGTLNNGLFFGLLFIAAIRLPGGVAATFQALGPLFMVLLALPVLGAIPSKAKLLAVVAGAVGVAMVVLKGGAELDFIGILAALGAALSVALGGTLIHKWGRPSSIMSLTAWQMIIAGAELSIVALVLGDIPESLVMTNVLGLGILALVITALPFYLWFTGIHGAGPSAVAPMMLLTPITAFVLDAVFRGAVPSPLQAVGVAIVIGSLFYGQHVDRKAFRPAHHHAPSERQKSQGNA